MDDSFKLAFPLGTNRKHAAAAAAAAVAAGHITTERDTLRRRWVRELVFCK